MLEVKIISKLTYYKSIPIVCIILEFQSIANLGQVIENSGEEHEIICLLWYVKSRCT